MDETIAKEVLCMAQPVALEAAILASEEETREQGDVLDAWRRDLEAARYATQRAQRQYDAAPLSSSNRMLLILKAPRAMTVGEPQDDSASL